MARPRFTRSDYPGMDIPYAITRGAYVFNWQKYIDGKRCKQQYRLAVLLVQDYTVNPVGCLSVYLPRDTSGVPCDITLQVLSKEFIAAIISREYTRAQIVFNKINNLGNRLTLKYLNL